MPLDALDIRTKLLLKRFLLTTNKKNLVAVRRSRPGILPLKNTVVNFVEVILKFFNIRKPLDRYNVRIMHVENLLTFSNSQYQIDEVNHDKIFQ